MLKLRDANVLIIKEFPNKNISISSLMLSLGIKQHKIIHLNSPHEALNRTFHGRFDILICDQSFRKNTVKSQDLILELRKSKTIDERSTIIMDCADSSIRDSSYYFGDVHLKPEDNQRDISVLIRKVFEKKNKVWPLLQRNDIECADEMEKRYQFFEQHYLEYQYDFKLNRAHHHLVKRELKQATELYGALIKEAGKRDYSLEISLFLNALVLNAQSDDALELYNKFNSAKFQLGQPFDEIGTLLMLQNGSIQDAYRLLTRSGSRWGLSLAHQTSLALMSIAASRYDDALVHFSSGLNTAKLINRDVAQHTLNYLFALLMLWMRSEEGSGLYEKKFDQVVKEMSRHKLTESESQHLALIQLHAEFLTGARQSAESVLDSFTRKLDKVSSVAKIHALFLSTGLSNKDNLTLIFDNLLHHDSVFMFEPLPPVCAALVKRIDFKQFASDMKRFNREKVAE